LSSRLILFVLLKNLEAFDTIVVVLLVLEELFATLKQLFTHETRGLIFAIAVPAIELTDFLNLVV
jgi:hypothetical protein